MRFMFILFTSLALSACLPLKQSAHVAPIVEATATVESIPSDEKDGLLVLVPTNDVSVASGREGAIKGENRVVVPYFRVVYYTENSPAGFTGTDKDKAIINAKLLGVTSDVLQRITDQTYQSFVDQMKQQSIAVLPMSSLSQSPTYQKFMESGVQFKEKTLHGPEATYVMPSGMRTSDSKISRGKEVSNIMNEVNASVMDVTLYVTHLSQRVDSKLRVVTGIHVEQKITVTPGSRMQFYGLKAFKCEGYCPNPVVNTRLGQPVYSTEKVGELMEIAKKAGKETGIAATALNLLTLGSKERGGNPNRYELHADTAKYEKVVAGVLKEASGKLVSSLISGQ